MSSVFIVQHLRKSADGSEDVKLTGVYSSWHNAEAAVSRAKTLSGFKNYPDGFSIDEYQIDKHYWEEGFVEKGPSR